VTARSIGGVNLMRLDGRNPLSLVKTDTGSRIVQQLPIQIDEGRFV
jgi:hypothetical protein